MKYKVLVIFLLFITTGCFAQKKSRADRYFANGDYINAAINYKLDLEKKVSKKALENIVECYYNTYQYKKAALYLKILANGKYPSENKTVSDEYNFMRYHITAALGNHEKALTYLGEYNSRKNIPFNRANALNEIEAFKLKEDDYVVKKFSVSSTSADFGAVKVDDAVYFVSDRQSKGSGLLAKNYDWTHRPFLDIYKVKVSEKIKLLEEPERLSSEINSKLHEGNFCFSPDKKTMYFSRSNSLKGKKRYDSLHTNHVYLYKTTYNDTVWSVPESLAINVPGYSMEHPALSTDGKTLYFSSNIPGGEGEFDLYSAKVSSDGSVGSPQNLGPVVNTPHREQFPYVSEDGNLFFASNGHLGLGMLDLFVSEHVKGGFAKPINLGAPLNSEFDDFSLNYFSKDQGFFSSNRKKANDNVYRFKQVGEIFIREYPAVFEVRDKDTQEFIPNVSVNLEGANDNVVYTNILGKESSFELKVLSGTYQYSAKATGYFDAQQFAKVLEKDNEKYIIYLQKIPEGNDIQKASNKPNPKKRKEEVLDDLLTDDEGPKVIKKNGKLYFDLPPIYFDYNKWTIREDSQLVLNEFAKKLERYKTVYIHISSHTDSRGSSDYNQILSHKRAESTRNYLALEAFVNARRMKFDGYGESLPIVHCGNSCTEEEYQLNRRSEFEIVKY